MERMFSGELTSHSSSLSKLTAKLPKQVTATISHVLEDSLVDGPGLRNVVFFSGCRVKCTGCHNQALWDASSGARQSVQKVADQLRQLGNRKITISGGEPLEQAEAVLSLLELLSDFDIGLYTSYPLTRVPEKILKRLSFVKVGAYKYNQPVNHEYYGSSNQQFISLKAA